ncbi:putative metalloprotease with PDZ domain [Christiangramia gaetbulicola]|uniref:Putative metalloprotease with PDZ domain n=1 Tax=Christiangramia gaetbulicola TaxID=703340 RepID=A0A2T6ADW7_9FLAO|nr:hypothetical protein [Christiangramia gaetbulicola]PTX42015.1 putative metalloprotease with PDZ domain [Christiangramia gaetbulicola]
MFAHKKQIIFLFILACFLKVNSQTTDSYQIFYNKDNPKLIKVEAELVLEDSLLYMSQFGSQSHFFPNYVKELEVKNALGNTIKMEFRDSIKWILSGVDRGQAIKLSYELHVNHEERAWPGGTDGVAYVRDYGVMNTGRSLFIMNGSEKKDLLVKVHLPGEFKISTPWESIPEEKNFFKVSDLVDLQEAFLFAGTFEEEIFEKGNFNLKFILGGPSLLAEKDRIINTTNNLLDYYVKMMGGEPKLANGQDLKQSMVIITENDQVDGEVIGSHISMFMDPDAPPQNQMIGWFILSHELFHLWNGKSLRYEGSGSDWFKEGVTNYYTLKGLNQVGFIDESAYLEIMNNLFYQRYINDPGLGEKTPVNSADGFSKDQHWGLIYGGGLFAGIAADMEIRNNSDNKKSLDDIMRDLYREFATKEAYIDNSILKSRITEYRFEDFNQFFSSYLDGTDTIFLQPYLKFAGAEVIQENGQLKIQSLENKTNLEHEIWQGMMGKID